MSQTRKLRLKPAAMIQDFEGAACAASAAKNKTRVSALTCDLQEVGRRRSACAVCYRRCHAAAFKHDARCRNLFAFQPVTSRGNTDRGGAVVPPCRANSRSGVVTNTQG